MIEFLFNFDVQILHFFNVDMADPYLDQFWLVVTHLQGQDWFAFGVLPLILGYLFYQYRLHLLKVIAAMVIAVGVTDVSVYRLVKVNVDRPRPFDNPEISSWVRKVGDAHGPGFPSNHAANSFAGAAILVWYFRSRRIMLYNLAGLIALSRVALGVHYPSDVLGGSLIGLFVGFLVRMLLLNQWNIWRLPPARYFAMPWKWRSKTGQI